jgi:hypothetical protein
MTTLPRTDLTLANLQPWALRAFDEAYERRPRNKGSREDVAYGWVQCLLYLHSFGSFKPPASDDDLCVDQ